MKTKTLHRHLHPIHWHGNMYVACAILLVSIAKTSSTLTHAMGQAPMHHVSVQTEMLREAETVHGQALMNAGTRLTAHSGS